jgi:hypothetical protein
MIYHSYELLMMSSSFLKRQRTYAHGTSEANCNDEDKAELQYDLAIEAARSSKFIHEEVSHCCEPIPVQSFIVHSTV